MESLSARCKPRKFHFIVRIQGDIQLLRVKKYLTPLETVLLPFPFLLLASFSGAILQRRYDFVFRTDAMRLFQTQAQMLSEMFSTNSVP